MEAPRCLPCHVSPAWREGVAAEALAEWGQEQQQRRRRRRRGSRRRRRQRRRRQLLGGQEGEDKEEEEEGAEDVKEEEGDSMEGGGKGTAAAAGGGAGGGSGSGGRDPGRAVGLPYIGCPCTPQLACQYTLELLGLAGAGDMEGGGEEEAGDTAAGEVSACFRGLHAVCPGGSCRASASLACVRVCVVYASCNLAP